ncbi:MAG TPA: hypothetical protein VEC06_07330 [Paucimonas sp.]|nr:hypothetical protein [Paucimonas sp.]
MKNFAAAANSRLGFLNWVIIFFAIALSGLEVHAADLTGLWNNTARFQSIRDYTEMPSGHKEGFAVERPDVIINGLPTVFLYHRCFDGNLKAQICLRIYDPTVTTQHRDVGLIVSHTLGVHAAAPSVAKINDKWTMVYEEGGGGVYWATSLDGIVWTKMGALFSDGIIRATPSLYVFQGVVYVFYAQFLDSSHQQLGVIFHSGSGMQNLRQYGGGYVLKGSQSWDAGSVSMPRIVFQNGYHWMFYEGGSLNFECSPNLKQKNLMGWGIARSRDLVNWEKWSRNPIMRHDATYSSESCGHDMPQPFISASTGKTHVFYSSNDTHTLKMDYLVDGNACGQSMQYPNWKETNHQCMPSCGAMGGTLCYSTKTCGSGTQTRLGMSHDCGSCCK